MSLYKNKYRNESTRLPEYDYSTPGYYFVTACTQDRIDRFGAIVNGIMIMNDAGKMVQSVWYSLPQRFPTITLDQFQIMPNHIHAIIQINAPAIPVGSPRVGVPSHRNAPHDDLPNDMTKIVPNGSRDNAATVVNHGLRGDAATVINHGLWDDAAIGDGETGKPTRGVPTGGMVVSMGTVDNHGGYQSPTLGDIVGAFKSIVTNRYANGVKLGLVPKFRKRLLQRGFYEHIIRNDNELARIRRYIDDNPAKWQRDKMNDDCHTCTMELNAEYGHEPWMV
jgi:REP element-mobilizing transposase RayT